MHNEIPLGDAVALRKLIATRQVSPVEVIRAALDRIDEVNPKLNLFVNITRDLAIAAAKAAEQAVMRGEVLGPLGGIPVTVKDNHNVAGVPTTNGSVVMKDNIAEADSPAVARLRAAGACILGKTTMPEFATKGVGDSPLTGISRNPWDLTKTPGGSSSGGAAGVAADVAPLALVTDGGGSTRLPASFCGVFGIKPQFGRVPYVPISATPTLSHVGIISNSVDDAALMLQVISGADLRDPASMQAGSPLMADAEPSVLGLRIAWSPTLGWATPTETVRRAVEDGVRVLEQLGCSVEQVDAPFSNPLDIWEAEFFAGAGSRLAPMIAAHRDLMDPAVVEQLSQVGKLTLADYMSKVAKRYEFREQVGRLFEKYDLLVTPTLPVTAFETGRNTPPNLSECEDGDITSWISYLSCFNLSGNPAASVPCGFDEAGLPIGMQIVGPAFDDAVVLRAAAAYATARPWTGRRAQF